MNTTAPLVDECVAALVRAYPVEDIWFLDPSQARECELGHEQNLVVIVPDGLEAYKTEEEMAALIAQKFPGADLGVHVFPQAAMFQTPRPLLVKMAFTGGKSIYCR